MSKYLAKEVQVADLCPLVATVRSYTMVGTDYDYDLITIGAGSAGTRASRIAAQVYKAKVATVELPFAYRATETEGGAGGT